MFEVSILRVAMGNPGYFIDIIKSFALMNQITHQINGEGKLY
jgi:hypothetical protein